jgi:hypothetical protein
MGEEAILPPAVKLLSVGEKANKKKKKNKE